MTDPHDVDGRRAAYRERQREAAARVQAMARFYRSCFMTDAGQQVLDDLRRCYGGSTVGHSPRKTEIHSAQRDVLLRIEDLVELAAADEASAVDGLAASHDTLISLMNPWNRYERDR